MIGLMHLQKNTAPSVRQVIEETIKNQNLRMDSMNAADRTKELLETVILDDVAEFIVVEQKQTSTLGFRLNT